MGKLFHGLGWKVKGLFQGCGISTGGKAHKPATCNGDGGIEVPCAVVDIEAARDAWQVDHMATGHRGP